MTPSETRQTHIPAIMVSVMISLLLAALDGSIVGTAMPKIIGELHGLAQYKILPMALNGFFFNPLVYCKKNY